MWTASSRQVYANPWMTVREDEVRRADGSDGIYGVVDKPDYALIIPLERHPDGANGRREGLWLVEQYRYPLGMRRWEFPQGTAPGLATAEPAGLAERELREETGLRAERMTELGTLDVAAGMSSQRGRAFLATELTRGAHERELEEQDMRAALFDRAEVEGMIAEGEVTDAQSIAAYTLLLLHERGAGTNDS
ncbi:MULTISPECIES: NUDIX hydrolase [unclassified Actinopolyspora]|uniref:NUDIX domain-containing protein n=1 Tax=unclassified Actinopolyspora TaxID=2639451 RepID=UPI0013F67D72|nr:MULTISPECIES: NUDIX hydrolase [unclassified Actinopolyspora]NHD18755.1 NUDIX hydrolase [Actinopolyspora sp. BKK2]NHE77923.1 NUDIX hydrolase [Actinopolyspora sp. BKK1]